MTAADLPRQTILAKIVNKIRNTCLLKSLTISILVRQLRIATSRAIAFGLLAYSAQSFGGNWVPFASNRAFDAYVVAAHPLHGGEAMVAAGASDPIVLPPVGRTTFTTLNGGATWVTNPRPELVPILWLNLSGTPTVAIASASGTLARSTDLGRSWSRVNFPPTNDGSPLSFELGAVNPQDPRELVAYRFATQTVARTVDGGATWNIDTAPIPIRDGIVVDWTTRRLYAIPGLTQPIMTRLLDSPGAWQVTPTIGGYMAASKGVALVGRLGVGICKSTDALQTCAPVLVSSPLAGDYHTPVFFPGPQNRVYSAASNASQTVLRSDDNGSHWVSVGSLPAGGIAGVDAVNPDLLYATGVGQVFRSTNGGQSFAVLERSTGAPGANALLQFDAAVPSREWQFFPASHYLEVSDDGGATFAPVESNGSLPFQFLLSSRARSNVLFGDVDGVAISKDGGITWTTKVSSLPGGGIDGPMVHERTAGFVVAYQGGSQLSQENRFVRSTDDGESWEFFPAPPIDVRAIAVTQVGPLVYFAGGDSFTTDPLANRCLYRSVDQLVSWQLVYCFPNRVAGAVNLETNPITSIVTDPTNGSRIYVGFADPDYLMRSDDGGATWIRVTSGLGAGPVTAVLIDPSNASTLYLSQWGSGVFKSSDAGGNWTALDSGLKDDAVINLQMDPRTPGRLYASTASGLFVVDLSTGSPTGGRRAIEFYHAQFNHYFASADKDEIAGLDMGVFQGWSRTGEGFRVTEATTPGSSPVCRFFSVGFAPLSTHFYTPYPQECEGLKTNPAWLYERIAFGLMLPDPPPSRGCRAESRPLYRLWNRNLDGAPNHRYTTHLATFDTMQSQGWLFEGELPTQVFACVPY